MGKLEIVDDIFAPHETIVLNFEGENPFAVYGIIRDLAEKIFQIEAKDIYEKIFKYDITGDPRWFYNVTSWRKDFDKWTGMIVRILLQGEQHTQTKWGNVSIQITAWLVTSYQYSNFIQRAFWSLYNRTFYYKTRRRYFNLARGMVLSFKDQLAEALGIRKPG